MLLKCNTTLTEATALPTHATVQTNSHLVYQLDEGEAWKGNLVNYLPIKAPLRGLTGVLLQGVLPLLAAQQHHQLHHGGGRLERVDGLGWRRIKGGGVAVKPRAL